MRTGDLRQHEALPPPPPQFPHVGPMALELVPLKALWSSGFRGAGVGGRDAVAEGAGPSLSTGILTVMSALSVAPSKAREYSRDGWEYLKERIK